MPHIGTAMARSLGEPRGPGDALKDLLARSAAAAMTKRGAVSSVQSSITDAKTAFSSWDNCMQASFCKWPVIAVIVVGGLIIFSIIWCIIRCACCGLSCCCECCYCLKCCGCCGCCDPPQKKKYLDEAYIPPHQNQGYRTEAPMTAARAVPKYDGSVAKPDPPQYAEFETGTKGGGDELPAMPSWEGSNSKKVMLEEESVELKQLKPESAQSAPLMAPGSMSQPTSPNPTPGHSPFGAPNQNMSGYMAPTRSNTDPYGMNGGGQLQGYGGYRQPSRANTNPQTYNQGYGESGYGSQGYSNQGYGADASAMAAGSMGQGRQTPHQDYNNTGGYGRGPMGYPQTQTPRPYDDYGRSGTPGNGANGAYGRPPQGRSPAPGNGPYGNANRMQPPAPPQQGEYSGLGQRSHTPQSYGRQYPPNPQRQYSSDSTRPLVRPDASRQYSDASYQQQEQTQPQSPIQNSGGFDFSSGYSRSPAPENRASPAPQQATGGGTAYPGYRPYKPQS